MAMRMNSCRRHLRIDSGSFYWYRGQSRIKRYLPSLASDLARVVWVVFQRVLVLLRAIRLALGAWVFVASFLGLADTLEQGGRNATLHLADPFLSLRGDHPLGWTEIPWGSFSKYGGLELLDVEGESLGGALVGHLVLAHHVEGDVGGLGVGFASSIFSFWHFLSFFNSHVDMFKAYDYVQTN